LTLPLIPAGIAVAVVFSPEFVADRLVGAVAGLLGCLAVSMVYRTLKGHEGLGMGDAKLLAAAGAWVGLQGLTTVILIASFAALIAAVPKAIRRRKLSIKERIPFGPPLALGIWIVWLYGPMVPR
jgi:leader peptidase (prepilin peptidase)/N-methyltransferase